MNTLRTYLFLCVTCLWILPNVLQAHAPDQSYLYLRIFKEKIDGTVEITTKDLNTALRLGLSTGGDLDQVKPHLPRIYDYLRKNVAISSIAGDHPLNFSDITLLPVSKVGDFVRFNFNLGNAANVPDELDVRYEVLFDNDPKHKGMLVIGHNWKAGVINNESMTSLVFGNKDRRQTLLLDKGSLWQGFKAMVGLGMWHIYIGLDHILFLLALILPSVVRRREGVAATGKGVAKFFPAPTAETWVPVARFGPALWYIVKIVTFFTIAHSVTLSLAALGIVELPSHIVEAIIALSIALAAYHNIVPVFGKREWIIAFGFGLFHGLGFASVLGEKGLSGEFMALSLLGFNVGVEIGQVLIICAIFPFLFLLRKTWVYPKILFYGSILLILISLYWFFERIFDYNLLLDDWIGKYYKKALGRLGLIG